MSPTSLDVHISGPVQHELISPIPSPMRSTNALPAEINAATRHEHTALNKLITARLALALPPYSDDPTIYTSGLKTFAEIYFAFEDSWQDLITTALSQQASDSKASQPTSAGHEERLRAYLSTLIPPGLWRTQRLEQDVDYLTRTFAVKSNDNDLASRQAKDFAAHVQQATQHNPHVLLAYAWVMYMATFSGGRWIRQQLADAGPSFWRLSKTETAGLKPSSGSLAIPGLSFLNFDGKRDGEDIKTEFKKRLEGAEGLLTQKERAEVLQEAKHIFVECIRLVEALDQQLGTQTRMAARGPGRPEDAIDRMMKKKGMHERLLENVEGLPHAYPTKGMHPLAALVCILVGVGMWYFLYSTGWLPRSGIFQD